MSRLLLCISNSQWDRNPRILASLPPPFVSLASFQLAGRGRGSNVWLSPAGCLQFSLLLRVDLGSFPPSKLVFVQYLFALAVAEACRDERVLGRRGEAVRIKWPNDIYATTPTGENKKIGGILVNTNFSGGTCHIVIGKPGECGSIHGVKIIIQELAQTYSIHRPYFRFHSSKDLMTRPSAWKLPQRRY